MDSYDRRILEALQKDATLTNGALSEIVNLSPSQCSRRRIALEAEGLITGYHAHLDAGRLGFQVRAIVRISLRIHGKDDHVRFLRWMNAAPQIKAAFSVSGSADYILDIRVQDLDVFSDFIHDHLLVQPQVAQVQSDIVLRTMKDTQALDLSPVP